MADIFPSHSSLLLAADHGVNIGDLVISIVGVQAAKPNSHVVILTDDVGADQVRRWNVWERAKFGHHAPLQIDVIGDLWNKPPAIIAGRLFHLPAASRFFVVYDNSRSVGGRGNSLFAPYAQAIKQEIRACIIHIVRSGFKDEWLPPANKYDLIWMASDYFPPNASERHGEMIRIARSNAPDLFYRSKAALGINLYLPFEPPGTRSAPYQDLPAFITRAAE